MSKVPLLIHVSEQRNVFADHFEVAKRAFPKANVVIWDRKPPSLAGQAVVKLGNSYYLGTEQFKRLGQRLAEASQVYVAINDYTSPVPTQVRDALRPMRRRVKVLTTVPGLVDRTAGRRMWDWHDGEVGYVDWNKASWKTMPRPFPISEKGLIYWGALRPGRVSSFDRYFKATRMYPVFISGALRSAGAWQEAYPGASWQGRLSVDEMSKWPATIYLEDECQHGEFHSVASRFYEALCRRMLVVVDEKCAGTFATAEIDVRSWLVGGPTDVVKKLRHADQEMAKQQDKLYRDYAKDTIRQLHTEVM